MKAIETHYNGYRFRSRLEARWAVFFDTLGIRYEYEPEGFEMDLCGSDGTVTIRYLPDFYIPDFKLYGEVKPAGSRGEIDAEDMERMSWFIDYGGPLSNGLIFLGYIPNPNNTWLFEYAILRWHGKGLEWGYAQADDSGIPDMKSFFNVGYYSAPISFGKEDDLVLTTTGAGDDEAALPRISKALTAARQARFEFNR